MMLRDISFYPFEFMHCYPSVEIRVLSRYKEKLLYKKISFVTVREFYWHSRELLLKEKKDIYMSSFIYRRFINFIKRFYWKYSIA